MYKTRIVLRFRFESLEELETTIQFRQEHKTQIVLKERSGILELSADCFMITLQTLTSLLLSPNDLIRLVETMQLTVRKRDRAKLI